MGFEMLGVNVQYARKRDGETLQPFDPAKLLAAVRSAWLEVGPVDEKKAVTVVNSVLHSLQDEVVDVETIQDAVETALMKYKEFKVAKSFIVYRSRRQDLRQAREKAVDPKGLSDYIHASKYARYVPGLKRREVYEETVARVEGMHLTRFPEMGDEIKAAFDLVRQKKVLPSMRSMQFGGDAILQSNCRIYNCTFSLVDRMEVFSEALFLLLSGCGVGYSVQFDHVEKLPEVSYIDEKKVVHHVVEDTIEGWADALKALVESFQYGTNLEFSFYKVRPAGSPLKTSGGRAPGHRKLKESLERIRGVLLSAQGRKLRPIECHRVMCFAADAVLSGGIRRSAMISLFSLDDSEMMFSKTGKWYETDPWFANANNSVVLKRDDVKKKQFKRIFQMTKQWGEPGFFFTDSYDYGTNPCAEIGLFPVITVTSEMKEDLAAQGEPVSEGQKYTGWAFCVSGDTSLLTRTGKVNLASAVGGEVEIWNGDKWCKVRPFQTGTSRKLYRVSLNDGSYLDCTDNHRWLVKDRFMKDFVEVETKDLLKVSKYAIHVPRQNVSGCEGFFEPMAYEYGFFLGDGHIQVRTPYAGGKKYFYPCANLYGDKDITLPLRGSRGPKGLNPNGVSKQLIRFDLDLDLATQLKKLDEIPDCVFNWSEESILTFVGGWADADGTQVGTGIRIYGSEGHIRGLQLLLTRVGINSSVSLMQDAGVMTNLGVRRSAVWYSQIPNPRGIKSARLRVTDGKEPPSKGKRQVIKSVEELPGLHDTFCLEEPEKHLCLFNNVLTKQCNLCEINAAKFTSYEDFEAAAHAATLIGTLQASYTKMPYLGWVSEQIAKRDALLGIGMTGMLDAPDISCNPEYQAKVALKVKEWNTEYAARLGIRPAARTTCVKPSGTTSLELGSVGSGHHPHHARRYIRRVTADELEPVFQTFRAVNPHMCVRKPDGKWVIEFPVVAPANAIIKDDVKAIQFLDMVKSTQQNWVLVGTQDSSNAPGLNHNVSNTVTVLPSEWDAVSDYLWANREYFTGVSLLASTGDKDFAFAPNEAVETEADEQRWNAILRGYQAVDYTSMVEDDDSTNLSGEVACAGGVCLVV